MRVRYATLSHCWGSALPVRTVGENLVAFHRDIPSELLPLAFTDAIAIARGLHICYIWIDALCTVEDNPLEWTGYGRA